MCTPTTVGKKQGMQPPWPPGRLASDGDRHDWTTVDDGTIFDGCLSARRLTAGLVPRPGVCRRSRRN